MQEQLAGRKKPGPSPLTRQRQEHTKVQGWLDLRWSPEQISARLAVAFPNDPGRRRCAESIHQALYASDPVLQRDPRSWANAARSPGTAAARWPTTRS